MNMAAPPLPPPGVRHAAVSPWRAGQAQRQADWLAEEVAVALVFNGLSHAVMMATPADLDDFALGFALSEGLIDSPAALYGCELQPHRAKAVPSIAMPTLTRLDTMMKGSCNGDG